MRRTFYWIKLRDVKLFTVWTNIIYLIYFISFIVLIFLKEQRASELTRRVENGGCVYAVGQGDYGQLGLGKTVTEKLQFAMLSQCQDAVSVVAGLMHSVYLTQDGSVFTSGCNDEGALGRDTFAIGSEMTPGLVKLEGKAVQITGGESHTATLLEDGRVFAWGTFRVNFTFFF